MGIAISQISRKTAAWLERPVAGSLTVIVLTIIILRIVIGHILFQPNSYLTGRSMDGIRSYFVTDWFVEHDAGVTFTGMNYPYGEHVVYTDNQPLITWLMNFTDSYLFSLEGHTVGILNSLFWISLVLSVWLLFLVARKLQLPAWYSIPLAMLIGFMSPQIHRLGGHLGLAYTFMIPLVWLLLIHTQQRDRTWLSLLVTGGIITLLGFVHPYNLLITSLMSFTFLVLGGMLFWRKNRPEAIRNFWMGGLLLLLPVLVFYSFLAMTDFSPDRPPHPYGFLEFRTSWESVFLPVQGPLWDSWNHFYHPKRGSMEGFAYVGFVSTLVLLFTLVRGIKIIGQGNLKHIFRRWFPARLRWEVWASVIMLLFAMGIPFIWRMEFLLDLIPPLRQFRSLGRFAWVFYYVFTMYAGYYLYLIFRRLQQKGLGAIGRGILVVAGIVWLFEAGLHLVIHRNSMKENKGKNFLIADAYDYRGVLEEKGFNTDEYQAILPVPFFSVGSDKWIPRFINEPAAMHTCRLAMDTGLPLMSGWLTRTPVSQAGKFIQIFSGPWVEKEILNELPNGKPLLLFKKEHSPINHSEQMLTAEAEHLFTHGEYAFYRLDLSRLKTRWESLQSKFDIQKDSVLYARENLMVSSPGARVYYSEKNKTPGLPFQTSEIGKEGSVVLYEGTIDTEEDFQASVWVKIDETFPGLPFLKYEEFSSDGAMIRQEESRVMYTTLVWNGWTRAEHYFAVNKSGNKVVISLDHGPATAGSFLLRPESADVYLPDSNGQIIMFNNFYLE